MSSLEFFFQNESLGCGSVCIVFKYMLFIYPLWQVIYMFLLGFSAEFLMYHVETGGDTIFDMRNNI